MEPFQFRRAVPVLRVASMQTSVDFYTLTLGFHVLWRTPDDRGGENCMLQSGSVDLLLTTDSRDDIGGKLTETIYFEVVGIAALFEKLEARISVAWPLEVTSHGMHEFGVRDPDGHVLAFSEVGSVAAATDPAHPYDAFLLQAANRYGLDHPVQIIKDLREHSGLGLNAAKDIYDDFIGRTGPERASREGKPEPTTMGAFDVDAFLTARITVGQATGRLPDKVTLIRELREKTNVGLAEAKVVVDAYCDRHHPDLAPAGGLLGRLFRGG